MNPHFSTIDDAIAAIRHGQLVIVVDAEDRENEGDFICAAEKATPEIVNFMIREGRGQLCMPILPDVAERLKLPQMVETNSAPLGTAFTVPVDHRTSRTASPPKNAPLPFRPFSIRPASRAISFVPATCSRWSRKKAASSAAPAIPKPPSIWPAWPNFLPPACCAKFSTTTATAPAATIYLH